MNSATALFNFGPATNTIHQVTQEEAWLPVPSVIGPQALVSAVDPNVAMTLQLHWTTIWEPLEVSPPNSVQLDTEITL